MSLQNQVITFNSLSAPILSIADILRYGVTQQPDKTALVFEGKRTSYAELWGQVQAAVRQLQDAGIKEADKVALLAPNNPAFIVSFFAIITLGAVVVPINPLFKAAEINHILNDSGSKAIIIHKQENHTASSNRWYDVPVIELSDAVLTENREDLERNRLSELAVLMYTSGTTGQPKGAMLSHANLLSILPIRLNIFNINENDVSLLTVPLYHIYGMTVVMLGTLAKGATLVILPKFEATTALRIIESEKISLLSAVPTMYRLLLQEIERTKYNLSSMRLCFSGGAPLDIELLSQIEQTFAVPVIEAYGMTESSCVASANPLFGVRKLGSVGQPLTGITIAIKDANNEGLVFATNQVGEIAIKGANVMLGYHNQPTATAETLKDGWLFTGDLGYLDKDGYLYIVGRKKELIIRGGLNIYPAEIERIIYTIPEVMEVGVIGVPDKTMGEIVKAIIVLKSETLLSAEDIQGHCKEYLAPYKIPTVIEFRESLPRNTTGKILKYLLN